MFKFLAGSIALLYLVGCIVSGGSTESSETDFVDDGFMDANVTCNVILNKTNHAVELTVHNLTGGIYVWCIEPVTKDNKTVIGPVRLFIHELFLDKDDAVTIFQNKEDVMNDNKSIIAPLHAQNGSLTIVTDVKTMYIKLAGKDRTFARNLVGFYHSESCTFPIPPLVKVMHAPVFAGIGNLTELECTYTYNVDQHHRVIPTFTFEEYSLKDSSIELQGSTHDGTVDPALDFFIREGQKLMNVKATMKLPTNETYRLKIQMVDSACSGYKAITDTNTLHLSSPTNILNNGTISEYECRWVVVQTQDSSQIFSIDFDKMNFVNVLDIVAVNDGGSERSSPLLQVTTSSQKDAYNQSMRTSKNMAWISFKPVSYESIFSVNITAHGQGGYFKNSGVITMKETDGDDTVFFLEVDNGKVIRLTFNESDFPSPAKLSLYDGFVRNSPLLATLNGKIWYPVVSQSNKLRMVATNFKAGHFKAHFEGVAPNDCVYMSTRSSEDYILSGNCNANCSWTIPPQDISSVLLLNLQYVFLSKGDTIRIMQLDGNQTVLGEIPANVSHVPQLAIPASIGAMVELTRGNCSSGKKDDVVLVGHFSYVPECDHIQELEAGASFHVSSPLYPDTYPIGEKCTQILNQPKDTLLHLAFDTLRLAPGHCLKITAENKTQIFDGIPDVLPDDILLSKGAARLDFSSVDCKTGLLGKQLATERGFLINGTVADCGGLLAGPSGQFNTSIPLKKNICIWKLSISPTSDSTVDDVNIISYSVSKKDSLGNYELEVHDGPSVRDSRIMNESSSEIWSRTNNLIFVYKRLNASALSSVLVFNYKTISCNASWQCDNKRCMHPDWRCNGVNDCGDFSDERNCQAVPVPPEVKMTGYSKTTFWLTIFAMLVAGIALGALVPVAVEKYRNGQYRRFGDVSVIG